MPKIQYRDIKLGAKALALVSTCNTMLMYVDWR